MGNESICVPRLVRTMTDEETVSSPSQNAIGDRGLELSSASQEAPRGRTYPLLTVGEIRERLEEMREKRRKEEEQEEPGELGEPGEPRAPGERITQFRSPDDSDRSHKEWRETFNKTAREVRGLSLPSINTKNWLIPSAPFFPVVVAVWSSREQTGCECEEKRLAPTSRREQSNTLRIRPSVSGILLAMLR